MLSRAPGAVYANEPDSPEVNPVAVGVRRGVWEHGSLGSGDEAPPEYEVLWAGAVDPPRQGRLRRSPRTVVVKTVNAQPTLEWIAERFGAEVVVVRANLLSVVSSWVRMGWSAWPQTGTWLEKWRPDLLAAVGGWPAGRIERVAVEVGMKACIQEELLARNPDWLVVSHEELCADPAGGFETLFEQLDLDFTDDVRAFIDSTNAPGTGHDITRIHAEAPRRWERLDPEDQARALAILDRLPLRLQSVP